MPQIEVTFDIDANGIVHVSAKDLGTGNQQQVTITASSNLNEEEIKRAVEEAERFASEDKKRKEEVETRNQADQLVYTTEKTVKEMEGKLDPADKENIEKAVADLKKTLEGDDVEMIKRRRASDRGELRCIRQGLSAGGAGAADAAERRRHDGAAAR